MLKPSAIVGSASLLLSMVMFADACSAQGGVAWQQLSPANSPAARLGHAMAYDAARQRVVLFGGWGLQDTWEWDGMNWTQAIPAQSPIARADSAMAYDAARRRVVLFGGLFYSSSYIYLQDTWEWDGVNWTQATPAQRPSARRRHTMVYDAERQRVVLFGGSDDIQSLGDTWEWDGNSWSMRSPVTSPPAQSGHTMAYDDGRQCTVMLEGTSMASGDTWEWDGSNWTKRQTASPPSSGHYCGRMVYDAGRQRIMVMGGAWPTPWFSTITHGIAEEWNGSSWVTMAPFPDPLGRADHGMVYDSAEGQVMMYGGYWGLSIASGGIPTNDTWRYCSVSAATFSPFGTNCPSSLGNLTLNAAPFSLPWTGDTFAVDLGNLPTGSFPFMALGFTQTSTPIPSLPGCTQLSSAQTAVSLTLNGNTATWSQTVPVNPALIGWSLFLQGAAFNAGGANVLGAALSNGGQVTIGMR